MDIRGGGRENISGGGGSLGSISFATQYPKMSEAQINSNRIRQRSKNMNEEQIKAHRRKNQVENLTKEQQEGSEFFINDLLN